MPWHDYSPGRMIVEMSDASLDPRRTTTVNNEDAATRRREGEGEFESCFPSSSRESLLGSVWQKKGPLTEAPGYHGRNTACFAMRVPPFKQLTKGSLRAPSTGFLMKHHSCLRIAHLARIFDSTLMSSDYCHAKHSEKEWRKQIFIGFPCTKETNLNDTKYLA